MPRRSSWRRRSSRPAITGGIMASGASGGSGMATEGNEEGQAATEPADELAELRAVVAKAKAGDAGVLPRLRAILDNNVELVEYYGDLGRHAEAAWLALVGGNNLYLKETLARA